MKRIIFALFVAMLLSALPGNSTLNWELEHYQVMGPGTSFTLDMSADPTPNARLLAYPGPSSSRSSPYVASSPSNPANRPLICLNDGILYSSLPSGTWAGVGGFYDTPPIDFVGILKVEEDVDLWHWVRTFNLFSPPEGTHEIDGSVQCKATTTNIQTPFKKKSSNQFTANKKGASTFTYTNRFDCVGEAKSIVKWLVSQYGEKPDGRNGWISADTYTQYSSNLLYDPVNCKCTNNDPLTGCINMKCGRDFPCEDNPYCDDLFRTETESKSNYVYVLAPGERMIDYALSAPAKIAPGETVDILINLQNLLPNTELTTSLDPGEIHKIYGTRTEFNRLCVPIQYPSRIMPGSDVDMIYRCTIPEDTDLTELVIPLLYYPAHPCTGDNKITISVTISAKEEICNDGADNDGDGAIDCEDSQCCADAGCKNYYKANGEDGRQGRFVCCNNAFDDDSDGKINCNDPDCCAAPLCITRYFESDEGALNGVCCSNSLDEDGDSYVDLKDPDCYSYAPSEICDDGIDNSLNGLIDCNDPMCCSAPNCPFVMDESALAGLCCSNGVDEDSNGQKDMADPKCQNARGPEDCGDGADNDGDCLIDSNDFDCMVCTPGETTTCETGLPGICLSGTILCQPDGSWGRCMMDVMPSEEICDDTIDNDCDGLTDMADTIDCPSFYEGAFVTSPNDNIATRNSIETISISFEDKSILAIASLPVDWEFEAIASSGCRLGYPDFSENSFETASSKVTKSFAQGSTLSLGTVTLASDIDDVCEITIRARCADDPPLVREKTYSFMRLSSAALCPSCTILEIPAIMNPMSIYSDDSETTKTSYYDALSVVDALELMCASTCSESDEKRLESAKNNLFVAEKYLDNCIGGSDISCRLSAYYSDAAVKVAQQ